MTKTEQQAYFQTRFAPDSRRECYGRRFIDITFRG